MNRAAAQQGFFSTFVEGRRAEILDAALAVFGEKGYEGGTMREIAALVGVSEPALYRHYAGKEALLVEMVEVAGAHMASTAAPRLAAADHTDVRSALTVLMGDRHDILRANTALMRTLMGAAQYNDAAREAFRRTAGLPMSEAIRSLVTRIDEARGIERSMEETAARARAMVSLLMGAFLTAQFFDAPDDSEIIAALEAMMGW